MLSTLSRDVLSTLSRDGGLIVSWKLQPLSYWSAQEAKGAR